MHSYSKHSELEKIRSLELESLNLKAQDAVAARDEFLSIASHELKTPLTTLKLQIQTMVRQMEKGTFAGQSQEKFEKVATVFNQQLVRLTGLVDNLLDVSRARAGRLLLSKEELNVTEVIQSIVEKFRLQGVTNNTHITFNAPESIVGLFDRLRIEQITENLISNAAKYAPGKPIHVRLSRENNHIKFEVEDFGVGISEENQLKIFERFERVSETSQAVSGLGLGLFITKQIIDAHGGSIKVISKIGHGSTFIVELPIESPVIV
jgi:signal transduction histidine kinase